jgi:predicted aminopeptidase
MRLFIEKIRGTLHSFSVRYGRTAKLLLCDVFWGGLLLLGCVGGQDVIYGWHLLAGQAKILMEARPIDALLRDTTTPDTLKAKLQWVKEIKTFANDSLGLRYTRSYERYYHHREGLLYVLTGSEKYRLKPYLWKFPIVGSVSYKGFLDPIMARREWERLLKQGYDVRLRIVNAWSTLGYLPDPVTTGMLQAGEDHLANTLIHEMFHATLYVPGETELSEGLATRVGDAGALLYLKQKYGPHSVQAQQYEEDLRLGKRWTLYLQHCARRLDSLYASPYFLALDTTAKDSVKQSFFMNFAEACPLFFSEDPSYCEALNQFYREANNAFFIIFRQYHQLEALSDTTFETAGQLRTYITQLRKRYGR